LAPPLLRTFLFLLSFLSAPRAYRSESAGGGNPWVPFFTTPAPAFPFPPFFLCPVARKREKRELSLGLLPPSLSGGKGRRKNLHRAPSPRGRGRSAFPRSMCVFLGEKRFISPFFSPPKFFFVLFLSPFPPREERKRISFRNR